MVIRSLHAAIVVVRGLGLLLVSSFISGSGFATRFSLGWLAAATAVYALVYLALRKRGGMRQASLYLTALDITIISSVVWLTGGFDSSAYLLFFAETAGIALYGSVALTIGYGAFIAVDYYLLVAHDLVSPPGLWSFGFRVAVFMLMTVGVGLLGATAVKQWRTLERQADEVRTTAEREQAVSHVAKTLTVELDHERVLELVLQSAVSILGASAGWVAMRDPGEKMRIASVVNFPAEMVGSDVPFGVADAGREPLPGSAPLQAMGFVCTVTAPIEVGGEEAGMLALFSREGRACGPEEHRLLRSLAELTAVSYTNARLFAERRLKEKHLACLNAIGRRLVERIDIEATLPDIRQELNSVVSADVFYVAAYDQQQQMISVLYFYDSGQTYPISSFSLKDGVISQAIRNRHIVHIETSSESEDVPGGVRTGTSLYRARSILVVPMIREERVVGALSAQSYTPYAYDTDHEQLVQTVANQLAVALENSRLYEQMRKLSMQDWLTGLGNARFFYQSADREIARAERYGHPLSLIMIDSDKLKDINDSYGHPAGDQHVVQLAEIIKSQARQADIGIRYAGDEFVIMLPETDETSALIMAERIRQSVERSPLQIGDVVIPVTVSLGVASYPRHGRTPEELFRNVDTALYQAKRAGKNHTSVYTAEAGGNGPMPVV